MTVFPRNVKRKNEDAAQLFRRLVKISSTFRRVLGGVAMLASSDRQKAQVPNLATYSKRPKATAMA